MPGGQVFRLDHVSTSNGRVIILTTVDGIRCLIDTGAECDVVTQRYVDVHNLKTEPVKGVSVVMADDRRVTTITRKCELTIRLPGDEDRVIRPLVMTANTAFDVIIGRPTQCAWHMSIHPSHVEVAERVSLLIPSRDSGQEAKVGEQRRARRGQRDERHEREELLTADGTPIFLVKEGEAKGTVLFHGKEIVLEDAPSHADLVSDDADREYVLEELVKVKVPDGERKFLTKLLNSLPGIATKGIRLARPRKNGLSIPTASIKLKQATAQLPNHSPQRLNSFMEGKLRAIIDPMIDAGIVKVSSSRCASRALLVQKPGKPGEYRLVVDFRQLNRQVERNAFAIPRISSCLARLATGKVFTKLDFKSWFHQLPLDPASEDLTAFTTQIGTFTYRGLPQGLTISANYAQMVLAKIFAEPDERGHFTGFVVFYIDDLVIVSENMEQHRKHLARVLERIHAYGVQINVGKCEFFVKTFEFLGHVIDAENGQTLLRPNPRVMQAVTEFPRPRNRHDAQRFTGLVNWFHELIPNCAEIIAPLTTLASFDWTTDKAWDDAAETAFVQIKQALTSAPVAALPQDGQPYVLRMDSSGKAFGGALHQKSPIDGRYYPVVFVSKKFNKAELNWSAAEKELYGLVYVIRKYGYLFHGSPHALVFENDHKPLAHFDQWTITPKLARWIEDLSSVAWDFKYIPGEVNQAADCLSRPSDVAELDGVSRPTLDEHVIALRRLAVAATGGGVEHGSDMELLVMLAAASDADFDELHRSDGASLAWHEMDGVGTAREQRECNDCVIYSTRMESKDADLHLDEQLWCQPCEPVVQHTNESDGQTHSGAIRAIVDEYSNAVERDGMQHVYARDERAALQQAPRIGDGETPIRRSGHQMWSHTHQERSVELAAARRLIEREAASTRLQPVSLEFLQQLEKALREDPTAVQQKLIEEEASSTYVLATNGFVYTHGARDGDARALYIPQQAGHLWNKIMAEAHHDMWLGAHTSAKNTYTKIRREYFWPNMQKDVNAFVRACDVCQRTKAVRRNYIPSAYPAPDYPFQVIAIDEKVGLPESASGNTSIFVIQDYLSRRIILEPCRANLTAEEIAGILIRRVQSQWGIPRKIVSDRGSQFTSRAWAAMAKVTGSERNLASSGNPKTTGLAERAIRSTLESIRKYLAEREDWAQDWDLTLPAVEFAYNDCVHPRIAPYTPFELSTGRSPRLPIEWAVNSYYPPGIQDITSANATDQIVDIYRRPRDKASSETITEEFFCRCGRIIADARRTFQTVALKQLEHARKRFMGARRFVEGEKVLWTTESIKDGEMKSPSLQVKVHGPFVVTGVGMNHTYALDYKSHPDWDTLDQAYKKFLVDNLGPQVNTPRRDGKNRTVNGEKLTKYYEYPVTEDMEDFGRDIALNEEPDFRDAHRTLRGSINNILSIRRVQANASPGRRAPQRAIIRVLDLCSGTQSVKHALQAMFSDTEIEYISWDIDPGMNPTITGDLGCWERIIDTLPKELAKKMRTPGYFDIVWFSPDCRARSMANTTGTRDLDTSRELIMAVTCLIEKLRPVAMFWENPESSVFRLRDEKFMQEVQARLGIKPYSTTYCKYAFPYMKPTTIWSSVPIALEHCDREACPARRRYGRHLFTAQAGPSGDKQGTPRHEAYKVPPLLLQYLLYKALTHGWVRQDDYEAHAGSTGGGM